MYLNKEKISSVQPDLGVIVATTGKDGELHTDTIVNCDAEFLSTCSAIVLQSANLDNISAGRTLYLCGHGNRKKRTISGLTMKQLAKLLVERHFSGKQVIKIASCHAMRKRHGKNLAEELQDELKSLGVTAECSAMANDTSLFWKKDGDCYYSSIHYHSGSVKIFHMMQTLLFDDVCLKQRKSNFTKNCERVSRWNKAVASGSLHLAFALTSGVLPIICTALIGIAMNSSMPCTPTDIILFLTLNSYFIGEVCYFTGLSLGIVCMLPLFAIYPPIAIIKVILTIILAIIANYKFTKNWDLV